MKQTIKYGQSPQHKTRNGKAIGERNNQSTRMTSSINVPSGLYIAKFIVNDITI